MIPSVLLIVLHEVFLRKFVVCPFTINIHITVKARSIEIEMHLYVFGGDIVLYVVRVADIESTVGILIKYISSTGIVMIEICMIPFPIPLQTLHAH